MEHIYTLSMSQYADWPMVLVEQNVEIITEPKPVRILPNYFGDWGEATTVEEIGNDPMELPNEIKLSWWSPAEKSFYYIDADVELEKADKLWTAQNAKENELDHFMHFVVGTAPYGQVALWLRGYNKSVLLQQVEAHVLKLHEPMLSTMIEEYTVDEQSKPLLPREQFASWMRQYSYRYLPLEEYWDEEEQIWKEYPDEDMYYDNQDVLSVEDHRTDGSFDYTGDYNMMTSHEAGRPRRFCVRWKQGNTDYESHYWLDDQKVATFFDYLADRYPKATIDIIVRIDPRARRYELALECDGLSKPLLIPPTAYQQLIFRDNREFYKSENYNQEDGAWRW